MGTRIERIYADLDLFCFIIRDQDFKKIKEQIDKPDSVIRQWRSFIIYLKLPLPITFSCLPSRLDGPSFPGLRGIAPHRVYLLALQHYLYLLSVALVLSQNT